MKKLAAIFAVAVICASVYMGSTAIAMNAEEEAVKKPLMDYLKGHETGQAEYMKAAFHTDGKLMYISDGKYSTIDFKDYIGRMNGAPAPDEKDRKRHIESIDVSGNTAVGKIVLDYPNVKFIDYMTLMKIEGEWKIVNKAFYREAKQKD